MTERDPHGGRMSALKNETRHGHVNIRAHGGGGREARQANTYANTQTQTQNMLVTKTPSSQQAAGGYTIARGTTHLTGKRNTRTHQHTHTHTHQHTHTHTHTHKHTHTNTHTHTHKHEGTRTQTRSLPGHEARLNTTATLARSGTHSHSAKGEA